MNKSLRMVNFLSAGFLTAADEPVSPFGPIADFFTLLYTTTGHPNPFKSIYLRPELGRKPAFVRSLHAVGNYRE